MQSRQGETTRLTGAILGLLLVSGRTGLSAAEHEPIDPGYRHDPPGAHTGRSIDLSFRTRDPKTGQPIVTKQKLDSTKMGIVIVDPWNFHWCMTAAQRFGAMAPRLNGALEAARKLGIQIFWSPTDVASQYAGWPQRERALGVPLLDAPRVRRLDLRINVGVGPCMCGPGIPCLVNYGWDGMNPDLIISERDLIVCGMQELFSLLRHRGITHLIYTGGHTNMCLIGKPDALKNMYEAGFECCVARDLNDAFTSYDPAKGWTPDDGTARVVADIEKSGVPTIDMAEAMARAGVWGASRIVDSVRLTSWGAQDRPYLFRASTVLTLTAPLLSDAQVRYTTDGSEPTAASPLYEKPLTLTKTTEVRAAAFRDGKPVSLVGGGTYVLLPPNPPAPDVCLSELTPVKRQYPHAIWHYWPKTDQSYEGAPLSIRGRTFKKGLGMRAPANELYELKPEFERFVALAGVDDGVLRKAENGRFWAMHASVQFRVFIDGELAAESPILRISQEPWPLDVKIPAGARRIDLVTTDAGSHSPFNLGNWVEAGFIMRRPPP